MALTDSAGTVTARLSYSPYGEVTLVSGTVATPFLFNGQFGVLTEPNGLYCMMARFYSPVFRRFLSEDPAGFAGGINLYAYAAGDPVNLMDPFGLGPISWQQKLVNFLPEYAVDGLASIIFSQRLVDFSAGTGDILSFGLTDVWRNIDGSYSWVLKDSSAYAAGEWTGTGIGFAVGGAGLAKGFANAGSRTLKQQLYEIGQKTFTKSEYNYFVARNADPVKRGIDIVRQQGWLRASAISPSGLATQSLKTIGTGLTPNAARNIRPISAGAYGATVGGYGATK